MTFHKQKIEISTKFYKTQNGTCKSSPLQILTPSTAIQKSQIPICQANELIETHINKYIMSTFYWQKTLWYHINWQQQTSPNSVGGISIGVTWYRMSLQRTTKQKQTNRWTDICNHTDRHRNNDSHKEGFREIETKRQSRTPYREKVGRPTQKQRKNRNYRNAERERVRERE